MKLITSLVLLYEYHIHITHQLLAEHSAPLHRFHRLEMQFRTGCMECWRVLPYDDGCGTVGTADDTNYTCIRDTFRFIYVFAGSMLFSPRTVTLGAVLNIVREYTPFD